MIRLSKLVCLHTSPKLHVFIFNFWFKLLPFENSLLSAKPGHGFWSYIVRYLFPTKSSFRKFLLTSLHVIFGLAFPQLKILATPMHGGVWVVPSQITACASQARVNFCTSTRGPANFCPKTGQHKRFFFYETARQIEWTWSSNLRFCEKDLFIFLSSPPNLRAKSIPKEYNIEFGAKYSPDCWGILKASGLGCVSIPPKVFLPPPPKPTTLATDLLLYCSTCSARTILWYATK